MSLPDTGDRKSSEASPGVALDSCARGSRQTTLLHAIILLLAAVLATRAIWGPALLGGHSAWIDLIRMIEFDDAVRHGSLLPTWSRDLYFGYGSPLFQFYAPLCYYLTEIPVLLGCDFPTALKVSQLVALWASGLAMYRLTVTYFSGWAACLGGVLYMVAPYRLVDIYVRHALAEHCAFVWLPLIIWGTERFVSQRSRPGLIAGVLATAALILTHNIMALIGLPVCVTAGWILSIPAKGTRVTDQARLHFRNQLLRFIAAGVPAVLGVGLATFFWWPAMSGRPLIQAEQSLTGGYYDFHHHFVAPMRFLALDWGFGSSGPDAKEKMSMQIGLPHLCAALGAVVILIRGWCGKKEDRFQMRCALLGLLIVLGAVFQCSEASHRLWEALPLVKYVQFPWRFLGLAVFGASFCGTVLAERLGTAGPRAPQAVFLAGLIIVLGAYFPYYARAHFLAGDARTHTVMPMTSAKVEALDAAGMLIPIGRAVTPAEIRTTRERATSSDDFLPRDVQQKPTEPPTALITASGYPAVTSTQAGPNHYRAEVQMPAPGLVELRQFWFPGWQATVDDLPTSTAPIGPQAVVSCTVPEGHHIVEFRYQALPQRRTGFAASLLALALTLAAIFFVQIGRQNPTPNGTA